MQETKTSASQEQIVVHRAVEYVAARDEFKAEPVGEQKEVKRRTMWKKENELAKAVRPLQKPP